MSDEEGLSPREVAAIADNTQAGIGALAMEIVRLQSLRDVMSLTAEAYLSELLARGLSLRDAFALANSAITKARGREKKQ